MTKHHKYKNALLMTFLIVPLFAAGIAAGGIQNAHAAFSTDPFDKIIFLILAVEDLGSDPDLNEGNINALTKKLENALKDLDNDEVFDACDKLESFIDQLEAFEKAGKLDESQINLLIDIAEQCIDDLCD